MHISLGHLADRFESSRLEFFSDSRTIPEDLVKTTKLGLVGDDWFDIM